VLSKRLTALYSLARLAKDGCYGAFCVARGKRDIALRLQCALSHGTRILANRHILFQIYALFIGFCRVRSLEHSKSGELLVGRRKNQRG